MTQPNDQSDKPAIRPYANFPNGLIVTQWGLAGDPRGGVMISVVDQTTRQGISAYLGHDGVMRLFSWLVAAGILQGEIEDEEMGDVMLQWPGPKPDAS